MKAAAIRHPTCEKDFVLKAIKKGIVSTKAVCENIGVFRILSIIYDGVFLRKQLTALSRYFFAKKTPLQMCDNVVNASRTITNCWKNPLKLTVEYFSVTFNNEKNLPLEASPGFIPKLKKFSRQLDIFKMHYIFIFKSCFSERSNLTFLLGHFTRMHPPTHRNVQSWQL